MEHNKASKYEYQTYTLERLKDLIKEINKEEDPKFHDKIKTLIAAKEFEKMAAQMNS